MKLPYSSIQLVELYFCSDDLTTEERQTENGNGS